MTQKVTYQRPHAYSHLNSAPVSARNRFVGGSAGLEAVAALTLKMGPSLGANHVIRREPAEFLAPPEVSPVGHTDRTNGVHDLSL